MKALGRSSRNSADDGLRRLPRVDAHTRPRIAHLADAELPEPVTLIGRWTALSLVRLALTEPVFDEGLEHREDL